MRAAEKAQDLFYWNDGSSTDAPKRHESLTVLTGAFLFAFAILAWIQFSTPSIADYDGYYHIKMAELIRQKGVPTDFSWLPYTILDESRFTDHHLLFHILQIPFTYLGDLRLAAKWSAVFFASCTFSFIAWILFQYRVRYPFFWLALIFAASPTFVYRMSMPRAQSLSLLLQSIAFYWILRKRYSLLMILSTIFVWTYNAFPTIAILVAVGFITERMCEGKWDLRILLFSSIGLLAGLVINPYFPNNVTFLWNHIVPKIFAGSYQTSVGSEWYPYSSWKLLQLSFVGLLSYGVALASTNREEWTTDKPRLFWMLTATVYLLLLMKSRRFIEYFPPFAVLALAFSLRSHFRKPVSQWIQKDETLAALLCGFLLFTGVFCYSIFSARQEVKSSPDWKSYEGASLWLKDHTPANSIVFHADWDDFPMLFFFNTHNRYIVGLDADFMRLRNEPVYRKYEEITQGRMKNPVHYIRRVFRSEYVFTDNQHEELMENLRNSGKAIQVYSDKDATIFKLL